MTILLGILIGLKEIWAHKFRSLLTMLGIVCGVACLTAMFALVAGQERGMRENIFAWGGMEKVELIKQEPPPDQGDLRYLSRGRTYDDIVALLETCPLILSAAPTVGVGELPVTFRERSASPSWLQGATPDILVSDNYRVAEGRFFNEFDMERHHKVCVIGALLRDQLFGEGGHAVGEIVYIGGQPFEVIGVLAPVITEEAKKWRDSARVKKLLAVEKKRRSHRSTRNTSYGWFDSKNRPCYLPITTAIEYFLNTETNLSMGYTPIKMVSYDKLDAGIEQMRNAMLRLHRGIEDFGFNTSEIWVTRIEESIREMKFTGGIIAGISLIVAGIGIVNILLASIHERVRELGVRSAIGATRFDLFVQILMESLVLSVLGGVLGLALAVPVTMLLEQLSPEANTPIMEIGPTLLSFGCAVAVGFFAGLFPAWKASRLNPVEALRYE
jgi:ABC-type antimicrobial peptide transport system permease subunit